MPTDRSSPARQSDRRCFSCRDDPPLCADRSPCPAVPPCGVPTMVLATAYFAYASTAIDDVLAVGGCSRTACRANERCPYAPVPRSTGPRQQPACRGRWARLRCRVIGDSSGSGRQGCRHGFGEEERGARRRAGTASGRILLAVAGAPADHSSTARRASRPCAAASSSPSAAARSAALILPF